MWSSLGLVLLPFHATVLEPDFNVPFCEAQHGGQFDPTRARDVLVEVELLLQLQELTSRVGGPGPFVLVLEGQLTACEQGVGRQ